MQIPLLEKQTNQKKKLNGPSPRSMEDGTGKENDSLHWCHDEED